MRRTSTTSSRHRSTWTPPTWSKTTSLWLMTKLRRKLTTVKMQIQVAQGSSTTSIWSQRQIRTSTLAYTRTQRALIQWVAMLQEHHTESRLQTYTTTGITLALALDGHSQQACNTKGSTWQLAQWRGWLLNWTGPICLMLTKTSLSLSGEMETSLLSSILMKSYTIQISLSPLNKLSITMLLRKAVLIFASKILSWKLSGTGTTSQHKLAWQHHQTQVGAPNLRAGHHQEPMLLVGT